MKTITAQEAAEKIKQGAVVIDIREAAEFRREHIDGAQCIPSAQMNASSLPSNTTVIFHCKSGMRTKNATAKLAELTSNNCCEAFIIEGGIDGWKKAGFATHFDRSQPIELMRQVQIAAGSLVLLGVLLGAFVHSGFYFISAFVGTGLVFAGVTGFCGMARLLALMPWNK